MQAEAPSCWADVFVSEKFNGPVRRLFGPVLYRGVRTRNSSWGIQFNSVQAGPGTYVLLCWAGNVEGTAYWLFPGERISNIDEIVHGRMIDSIQIFSSPPSDTLPGYAGYLQKQAIQQR